MSSRPAVLILVWCIVVTSGVTAMAQDPVGNRGQSFRLDSRTLTPSGDPQFLTGPNQGTPEQIALEYIRDHKQALDLTEADLNDMIVASEHVSEHTGVTHLYFRQRYKGIEVWGGDININIAKDGRVINIGSTFVSNLPSAINRQSAGRHPAGAVESAAKHLGLKVSKPLAVIRETGGPAEEMVLSDGGIAQDGIPAKLVYLPVGPRQLRLAWQLEIEQPDGEHWWNVAVDAETGEVLDTQDYVVHDDWGVPEMTMTPAPMAAPASGTAGEAAAAPDPQGSYRVFAWPKESPNDGPRTLEVAPADPVASPYGWHDTNGAPGAEFTITRGNNVHAYTDIDANNVVDPGSEPSGGADLIFDFPLDLTLQPSTYRPAVVTSLFYWNNIIHDFSYPYGFTESAGNFQVNNYGRFGPGFNDDVRAEAQDGSGTNNANFSTPTDGSRPRMQMFVWTNPLTNAVVIDSGPIAGSYRASNAQFGPQLTATGITGLVALINDGTAPTADGCEPLVGFPAGQIALLDRGTCTFVIKVKNAQNAGAIAVIVVNNAAGNPIVMGGTDATITIPSVMVSLADGDLFKANLPFGANLKFDNTMPNRDSDLDAGVIMHEYTHGISNRLTGGRTNVSCLNNNEQMGEGWSDWMALAFTAKPGDTATMGRGVGTYVSFQPPTGVGIRPTPYSTDMTINPTTYANISTLAIPHGVGYAWATMAWEVYWNLVNKYGFNPDVRGPWWTGGNNLAIQLVMDGMKLQPCSPGFVTGRNAILQADQVLTGGANQCLIWKGFAKRGLGFSASQGSSSSVTDGVQAFDLPAACQAGATVTPTSLASVQECSTATSKAFAIHNTSAAGGTDLTWAITEAASACASPSDLPWVSAAPSSGTTAPGADTNVDVTFDAADLGIGTYAGTLCVGSNAPGVPKEVSLAMTVVDTTPPAITAPSPLTLAADPAMCGRVIADATLGAAIASDNCAAGATVTRSGVPAGNVFPVGTTTVTYTATDAAGLTATATQAVSVVDSTPAVITNAAATPSRLWPPNHGMVDVTIGYVSADNCGGALTTSLSVTSNEPVNGTGDGDTAPDWEIVDAHHVLLRAERAGAGTGRVYTITITATDVYGNTSTAAVTVTVAHDSR